MIVAMVYSHIQGVVQVEIVFLQKNYRPADVNSKLLKLRMDFGIGHSNKMMVFISLATKDMVRYMSMYPEVWFMDCTAGV